MPSPLVAWLTFSVGIVQLVVLTTFAIGRWAGKQESHETPQPINMGELARHEEELKRCRDRLHALEGFRQAIAQAVEDRHPTRREFEGLERRLGEMERRKIDR